jgi:hypothetical protein
VIILLFLATTYFVVTFAVARAGEPVKCRAGVGAASYPGNVEGTVVLLPQGCTP